MFLKSILNFIMVFNYVFFRKKNGVLVNLEFVFMYYENKSIFEGIVS